MMTSYENFKLKNRMLFYNIFTNLIGVWIVILLSFRSISPPFYEIAEFAHRINLVFIPVLFSVICLIQISYEYPIRNYLKDLLSGGSAAARYKYKAQQRLLNAPFFIVGIDFLGWTSAAIIYFFFYRQYTTTELAAPQVFYQNLLVGLISMTAAFFVMEQVLQKSLVPHLFPEGGMYKTAKTIRNRISTRLAFYLLAVNLIPFLALLVLVQGTYGTRLSDANLLAHIRTAVVTYSLISIAVGICLTALISLNLSRPMKGVIRVLKCIHKGDLDEKVYVTANDEIGYAGDVINEMTRGLKERERMKQSLELAHEVQVKLLPDIPPRIKGLDIAGISLYCDETGGDYYDYISLPEFEGKKVGVVIGDVSDHGVHSALLMTTARAFIRLRAATPDFIEKIIADVNRQLAMDIEDGGQFMTMFYLMIDVEDRTLNWVRAGHEPALLFDVSSGDMIELKGKGIPLGIDKSFEYRSHTKTGLAKGQIVVLSTDGIWEARNRNGEIFGKERFHRTIRQLADQNAESITKAVMKEIKRFQDGFKIEDDITMVVIKIEQEMG